MSGSSPAPRATTVFVYVNEWYTLALHQGRGPDVTGVNGETGRPAFITANGQVISRWVYRTALLEMLLEQPIFRVPCPIGLLVHETTTGAVQAEIVALACRHPATLRAELLRRLVPGDMGLEELVFEDGSAGALRRGRAPKTAAVPNGFSACLLPVGDPVTAKSIAKSFTPNALDAAQALAVPRLDATVATVVEMSADGDVVEHPTAAEPPVSLGQAVPITLCAIGTLRRSAEEREHPTDVSEEARAMLRALLPARL